MIMCRAAFNQLNNRHHSVFKFSAHVQLNRINIKTHEWKTLDSNLAYVRSFSVSESRML